MSDTVTIDDQNIPRRFYRKKSRPDWEKVKNTSVPFSYKYRTGELITGDLIILDTFKEGKYWQLRVQYGNIEPHIIESTHFMEGKIGSIIGVNTKRFKFFEGQHIKDRVGDHTRDITITKVYRHSKKAFRGKFLDFTCNSCHTETFEVREETVAIGTGCPVCDGKSVSKDVNDIPTTASEIVQFFVGGEEEAGLYTKNSNKMIKPICPNCGKVSDREIPIYKLSTRKTFGCACHDKGISFSEKFSDTLFKEFIGDRYQREVTIKVFTWCGSYRYDAIIRIAPKNADPNDPSSTIIIELHGIQHYVDRRFSSSNPQTLADVQRNDKMKKELAIANGIKEENYYVINCRYTSLNWLKNSFIKSGILEALGIDAMLIDWVSIYKQALKSHEKVILEFATSNKYKSIQFIAEKCEMSVATVRRVLKDNNTFNETERKTQSYRNKPIIVITPEKEKCQYPSLDIACERLRNRYPNIEFYIPGITISISRGDEYKGFMFDYIESYEADIMVV